MIGERRSAELVGPRFRDDVDGRAAGHSLLGVEVVGRDVDRLDRLGRRHVDRMVRQPDEDVRRPVLPGVVVVPRRAVDVRRQRARRRVDDGILEARGRRARDEIDQLLVVAVVRQRQVRDLGALELGDLADRQRDVEAADRVGRHRHVGLLEFSEPLQRDRHGIRAGLHIDEIVRACLVCRRFTRQVGVLLRDGDGRARQHRVRRVLHVPDD